MSHEALEVVESQKNALQRGTLSNIAVFAQSVAGIAPTVGAVALVPLVFADAHKGAWLTVVIATIAVLAVGSCLTAVARYHVSSGAMYNLVPQGLGRPAGLVTGLAMLVAVTVAGPFLLIGIGIYIASFLQAVHVVTLPGWAIFLCELAILGVVAFMAMRRIILSTMVMLLLEGISMAIVLAILGLILATHNGGVFDSTQLKLNGFTFHGVIIGVVFLVLDFGGFESSASLGFEARNPRRAIPIGVLGSVLVVGVFFAIATYVQVLGFEGLTLNLSSQSAPLATLSTFAGATWLGDILLLGVIISFFSCSNAWLNYGSRLLFTMSGDGVLPRRLGAVRQQTGTPVGAVIALLAAYIAIITYVFAAGVSLGDAFGYLGSLLGYSYCFFYLLMAIAAPVWAWRRQKLNLRIAVSSLIAVVVLIGIFYYSFVPFPAFPLSGFLVGFVAYAGLSIVAAGALRLLRPSSLARIGTTEESLAE